MLVGFDLSTLHGMALEEQEYWIGLLQRAVAPFGIPRSRVRRWIRSCVNCAVNRVSTGKEAIKVLTPEVYAALNVAVEKYQVSQDQHCRQRLEALIPPALLRSPHREPREDGKSRNSDSFRKKKRIKERMRKVRQRVEWAAFLKQFVPVFVVSALVPCTESWEKHCWTLEIKCVPDPLSKAQAVARWMNAGWSYTSACVWWDSLPALAPEVEVSLVIDEDSRQNLVERLRSLVDGKCKFLGGRNPTDCLARQ